MGPIKLKEVAPGIKGFLSYIIYLYKKLINIINSVIMPLLFYSKCSRYPIDCLSHR
jgi:hypothetical protein